MNNIKNCKEVEKGVGQIDTLGGLQNLTIINESGLYNVILRTDKPEAKAFKRWVTHEVLSSIRKTGGYITPKSRVSRSKPMARDFSKVTGVPHDIAVARFNATQLTLYDHQIFNRRLRGGIQ